MSDNIYKIAVADCEADPSIPDRRPFPFVWGFEAVDIPFHYEWSDTYTTHKRKKVMRSREEIGHAACEQFVDYLYSLPDRYCIYMHNGGKYDFMFLLPYLSEEAMIINGRIVEAQLGPHKIRDSFAAMPVPLASYKKDDIDYTKLEIDVRDNHRQEILHYLGGDCRYLLQMVTKWREEFGDILTMATGAMRALKQFHKYEKFVGAEWDDQKEEWFNREDRLFREFYFGGRNQCFEVGEIKSNVLRVYDINSSYPNVMRNYEHPISATYDISDNLTDKTDFVVVTGTNRGALCAKDRDGHLSFTVPRGTFKTTGHELRAALETGTFDIERIETAYTFHEHATFAEFVDHYYGKRLECAALAKYLREQGDESGALEQDLYVLFWKLVLNSAYGKFALNCADFKEWYITEGGIEGYMALDTEQGWSPDVESGGYIFWSRPAQKASFVNVATGASITGAARAYLLQGLAKAQRAVYCDTDSIICESLAVDSDTKRLGAWKLEAEGDTLYVGGKKLYALYRNGNPFIDEKGKEKKASKGVKLSCDEIRRVALGSTIEYANPFPAFKLDGGHEFVKRSIRRTDKNIVPFGV